MVKLQAIHCNFTKINTRNCTNGTRSHKAFQILPEIVYRQNRFSVWSSLKKDTRHALDTARKLKVHKTFRKCPGQFASCNLRGKQWEKLFNVYPADT